MSHKGFIFVLLMFKPIIVYPNMYYNNSYVLNGEHEIVALVVSHLNVNTQIVQLNDSLICIH